MAGRWNGTVSGGALLALLISTAVFVASGVLFYVWSAEQVSVAKDQHVIAELKLMAKEQTQKETDAQRAVKLAEWKADTKRKAQQDTRAADMGYEVISGAFYYKIADDGYHCTGESKCASFTVMTGDACASGLAVTVAMYKEASATHEDSSAANGFTTLVRDEGFIGAVYGVTEGLPAGGVARLNVDLALEAITFRVTEVHCLD